MIQILRLLKGYVEFCADGGFPERFINLCNIKGINLWNVKNDGVKVLAFTTEREFQELKIPAENSGMTIKIIKSRGLKSPMVNSTFNLSKTAIQITEALLYRY